ncbi:MAG TPA: ankyrin repeat domain-containing protein [Candidatus Angelobacter sp.]
MNRWKWLLIAAVPLIVLIIAFEVGKPFLVNSLAQDGKVQLLQMVVKLGGDVNQSSGGSYPLIRAIKARQGAMVSYLLAQKPDVNVVDEMWATPLIRAVQVNDAQLVKELIAAGADINKADQGGISALGYALRTGRYEPVEILVRAGADVNTADGRGETPLIAAAHVGNMDVIKLLLQKGADFMARDKGGHVAYEYLPNPRDPELIMLLRRVYFVPIGEAPMEEINALAGHYREKFGMDIKLLPSMKLGGTDYDPERDQVIAENLLQSMARNYPEYANNWAAVVIGITGQDMYPLAEPSWTFCFGWRGSDQHSGVISTRRLALHFSDEIPEEASLTQRLRKAVTKDIGLLYFWKPSSHNPKSVLYDGIGGVQDLDVATENF